MKKLIYAPLTFMSLGGNASLISTILASAVAFLEGYSSEDLEASVEIVKHPSGYCAASTQLQLVPYGSPRNLTSKSCANKLPFSVADSSDIEKAPHNFTMSRIIEADMTNTTSIHDLSQLNRFVRCFNASSLTVDAVANEILLTTNSVKVVETILRLSSEAGLTIPRTTLILLQRRIQKTHPEGCACIHLDVDMDVEKLPNHSLLSIPTRAHSFQHRKRTESRLERKRRSNQN